MIFLLLFFLHKEQTETALDYTVLKDMQNNAPDSEKTMWNKGAPLKGEDLIPLKVSETGRSSSHLGAGKL